jgi:hypothetical protein
MKFEINDLTAVEATPYVNDNKIQHQATRYHFSNSLISHISLMIYPAMCELSSFTFKNNNVNKS